MKSKIFLFYDYFTPAYKAGGPIQSCTNLVEQLESKFQFYVYTTCYDLDGTLLDVKKNQWVNFSQNTKVFYADKTHQNFITIKNLIKECKVDTLYIQGMFSLICTVYPVLISLFLKKQIIIAPRGMLQEGALALKSTKKNIYLKLLKPFLSKNKITWHATDKTEKEDIEKYIGQYCRIKTISNIPRITADIQPKRKEANKLNITTISLIARKKNHLFVIKSLGKVPNDIKINYDIYGPIKEQDYYNELKKEISKLTPNIEVNFKGSLTPNQVDQTLQKYDLFTLPTLGENFGHAIFEALGSGIPICISENTPWQNLGEAGFTIPLQILTWQEIFITLANESDEEWCVRKKSARKLACSFIEQANYQEKYTELFR
ncbi:glycosyltransferase [Flammeovirga pacifica]|nr:glycosyltransferase [Flammeovirga pacifica]